MNSFDEIMKKAYKKKIDEPLNYEEMVQDAINNNYKISIFNKVAMIILSLIMSGTVVFATSYMVYESIWKEPEKITKEEIENEVQKIKEPITEAEKSELITEEQAVEKSNDILEKIGYKEDFNEVNIIRGYDSKMHYILKGKNVTVNLNPENGAFEYFCNNRIANKKVVGEDISEEKAREIVKEIYTKLNVISENDGYEIMKSEKKDMASGNIVNSMWEVSYAKKHGDSFDKDTIFTTCFFVENGEPIFYIIRGKRENDFENNPVVLSKEEAIKIAESKEKELTDIEFSVIKCDLEIKKINTFFYQLENNIVIEEEDSYYKVDDISRNVWVIKIEHQEKGDVSNYSSFDYFKKYGNKYYYIDATTGEIVGGSQAEIEFD